MTGVDTRVPTRTVTIKRKSASACRFIAIIALALFVTATYLLFKESSDSLGNPSEELVIKTIPRVVTKLEGIDPDERDLFQGFRTSFLPAEEISLANKHCDRKREIYEGNVTSDIFIWCAENREHLNPTRVKRRSHFKFTSQDDKGESSQFKDTNTYTEGENESSKNTSIEEDYDNYDENSGHSETDETIETAIHPETHVDRGPLDDVIEQVRGQPELEEGEMGSSPYLFKPSRINSGIHAFWKDQGNKETIRHMQAQIMKQYMDAEADPCHDYYQYACGNWASLNPIPADKAGYDTFEMLRENLDTVLKELLELKSNQQPNITEYPSPHLYLDDIFLKQTLVMQNDVNLYGHTNNTNKIDKSEIIKRIRRYLDRKAKKLTNPIFKMKKHVHKIQRAFSNNMNRNKYYNKLSKRDIRNIKKKIIITNNNNNIIKDRLKVQRNKRQANEADKVIDNIDNLLKNSKDLTEGDATLKAKFLFKSCMNYEILKNRGHQPLLDLLQLLGGWPILDPSWQNSGFDWLELMAQLRLYNNDILISEWVGPDIKNSDEFVIQFDQTSLGLPTREYYLQDSNKVYLEAYRTYLIKIAILLGGDKGYVKKSADRLIEFESKLAKITSAPEDRRNVSELYRRMSLKDLEKLVPEIKWQRYLCVVMNRTVSPDETVVLFALNYVKNLVQLIQKTDSSVLANYLLWRFVRHRVNNLDDRFQIVKQQFYFTLFGREQSPPRWKNCISQVNSNMGMALGSMFVRKYFDEKSKNDTLTMTREIQQSFKEILHMIDWIDDGTKRLAAHKVDAMMLRIGYPSFILNKHELDDRYKEVRIHPHKYFENILNILRHLTKMEQSRIGQPVNKTLWNTAPAVVNAYYSRNKNQIMFPAGILQPPFYHRHFPRSLNYGGIGVVIGHEITHGFDDKGRLFDCDGNLHRWWTDSAIEAFHRRAQCLIDQYGKYVVPEVNMKLDGVNTQGENIADNGGVKQAFRAYTKWLKMHGTEDETLPGLNQTHKQLFFLNFAQVWCGAMRPEAMRNKLKTAVHSPGRFRVIGTLSNSLDFAREYRCAPGTPMNPLNKCAVW